MTDNIYSELNVRLENVDTSDSTIITDKEAILQSLNRFISVEKGSIPYFRNYGLSLKRYSHYPLTEDTAKEIYNYCKTEIENSEKRIEITDAFANAIPDNNVITMYFTCKIIATGQYITTNNINILVNT